MGCSGSKNKIANDATNSRTLESSSSLHKMLTNEGLDQSRGETNAPEMSVGEHEVSDWLTLHGVNKYTQTLIDGGCSSLEILKDVEENDLKEFEIPKLARRTIMKHVNVLKGGGGGGEKMATARAAVVTSLDAIDTAESVVEAVQGELTETTQVVDSEGTL